MTKYNQLKGVTLTELLIVTALMGIFMLGVASYDYAAKQMQITSSNISLLSMTTTAAMIQINNDTFLVAGRSDDPGYDEYSSGTVTATYLRQGDNGAIWAVYRFDSAGTPPNLTRCLTGDTSGGINPICFSDTGSTVLQNVVQADFNFNPNDPELYLEVILVARADPTQAFHPVKNPQSSISTRINLPGHSW